jgi:ribose transport system permease protein
MLYAVGGNTEVSKIAGINVNGIKISAFMIASILAGFAGILLAAQVNSCSPLAGNGWELQAIASSAIGGVSMKGGKGTTVGTFIGVILLAIIANGLVLLGIDPTAQTIVIGVIMISAVVMDSLSSNRRLVSNDRIETSH